MTPFCGRLPKIFSEVVVITKWSVNGSYRVRVMPRFLFSIF